MAIKKSSELDFSNKKISFLICARPGVGKTTLAESAPKPLIVDLENGIDRVEACYRGDVSTIEGNVAEEDKYELFVHDLLNEDLSDYETIIIDSLGKLVDLLKPVVIKESAANALKDGKTLSMKGYGAVSQKVSDFIQMVKGLGKHVGFISHVTEKDDGEVIKTRLNIAGSTKDKIWDDIDLGGYMTYLGKDRVIYFTPSEQWDAKGTHGITGMYKIPTLKSTKEGGKFSDNHFLSDLFRVFLEDLNSTKEQYNSDLQIYNNAMLIKDKLLSVNSVEQLNSIVEEIKNTTHALTSREELLSFVQNKAKELNAIYDKTTKHYITKEQE